MGQGLSRLSKCTVRDENVRIKYAASSVQGFRSYMDDARAIMAALFGSRSTSFFGVYDGHGGANIAKYCASQFHTELLKDEERHNNLDEAVRRVFFRMDDQLRENDGWRTLANPRRFRFNFLWNAAPSVKGIPYSEGSTACVALTRETQIIVASVGDSRCVLSRNGQAMDLSTDHKPELPDERLRVENAQGQVEMEKGFRYAGGQLQWGCHRVNGNLAMSRAIGDFHFKSNLDLDPRDQMVTCNPDVLTHDAEFLLVASDGIWDMLSSQGVVDFVSKNLAKAVANPTSATFLRVVRSELIQKYLGDGPKLARLAGDLSPSIVFVDEIDAVGTKRYDANSGGERQIQRTLLEVLRQLDGFDSSGDVKVILATNLIETLDPVLLHPGWIDRKIEFPLPYIITRQRSLQIESAKTLAEDVNLEEFGINEFSGDTKAIRERMMKVTKPDHGIKVRSIHRRTTRSTPANPVRLLHSTAGKVITKKKKIPGNTAQITLNMDDLKASKLSYRRGIRKAQAWFRANGKHFDLSDYLGEGREVYTTPAKGTFHLTFKVLKRKLTELKATEITLFINARDGYLKGWKSRHGVFEAQAKKAIEDYIRSQACTILKTGENYNHLVARGEIEKVRIGPGPMMQGVYELDKCEETISPDVIAAIGMFSVNACEAFRLEDVEQEVEEAFEDFKITTLGSRPGNLKEQVRSYGHYSWQLLKCVDFLITGQPAPEILNRRGLDYKSLNELLDKISVAKKDSYLEGLFSDESVHEQIWYPPYADVPGDDTDDDEDEYDDDL